MDSQAAQLRVRSYADAHLLVHNVSNIDVVFGLKTVSNTGVHTDVDNILESLVNPKFDYLASMCETVHEKLKMALESDEAEVVMHEVDASTPSVAPQISLPVGFRLRSPLVVDADLLRFRTPPAAGVAQDKMEIDTIYFPLIGTLMPSWLRELDRKGKGGKASTSGSVCKALYLLSGSSFLDDADSIKSNSSEAVGDLLLLFLKHVYPDTHVHHIVSGPDVVHYDANVFFVKSQLVPLVDAQRRALVATHPEAWRKHFSLVLSLAAGVPARVAALNAALRPYQPSYLHMSNVKAFWYSGDMSACHASLHFVDFDSVEGTPAVSAAELDEESFDLVMEMKRHIAKVLCVARGTPDHRVFHHTPASVASPVPLQRPVVSEDSHLLPPELDIVDTGRVIGGPIPRIPSSSSLKSAHHHAAAPDVLDETHALQSTRKLAACESCSHEVENELASFWLRKTRQPVLAVLLVRKGPFSKPQYFYGLNVEVSMPTGSVCSERVAISSALATDPGLRRRDIRAVAVLSLPKLDHPDPRVQSAYETAGVAPASTFYKTGSATMSARADDAAMMPPPPRQPSVAKRAPSHRRDFPSSGAAARSSVESPSPSLRHAADADVSEPEAKRARRDASPAPTAEVKNEVLAANGERVVMEWGGSIDATPSPKHVTPGPPGSFANQVSPNSREKGYAFIKRQAPEGYTIEIPVALNPIAPCGSCTEWLKKVAEVNPDFKILTFTDISCDRVFVKTVPWS